VSAEPTQPTELDVTLRKLADRAFTATLHRLRGVRGLLHGWSQVGVPVQDLPQLDARFEEDLELLARLDWLRSLLLQSPPLERLEGGEAPLVLLACAMGHGSPGEVQLNRPQIIPQAVQPAGALSLALWLEEAIPYETVSNLEWSFSGDSLHVRHGQARNLDCTPWTQKFGSLLADGSAPHQGQLVYRRGIFRELSTGQAGS